MKCIFSQKETSELAKIVEKLSSKKPEQRAEAERALRQLEPEAIMQLLEEEARKRQKRKRGVLIGVSIYVTFMLVLAIGFGATQILSQIGSMTGVFVAALAASQAQRNAAKWLAQYDDLRIVGHLADALEYQYDKEGRMVVEEGLIRLLPRMRASDAHLLNKEQRNRLHRALNGKNPQLTLKILPAFEQVGDSHAIPFVEKLANGEGRAAKNPDIREAARECLPFLQERAERERASQELLRASSPFDMPSDTLLRAANGAPETTNPQELLRASATSIQTTQPVNATQEQTQSLRLTDA